MSALFNLIATFGLVFAPQAPTDTTQQLDLLYKQTQANFYKNIDSSVLFARNSVRLATQAGRQKDVAKGLNYLAKAYYIKGDYYGSLAASNQAINVSSKSKDFHNLANATNSKGLIFLAQDRFADAITEFQRAAALNLNNKNFDLLDGNYINIGICYDELGRHKEALNVLNKAAEFAQKTSDWHIMLMVLNRKGETNFHADNYPEALKFYQEAIAYVKYQDDWEMAFAHAGIAQTLLAMDRPQEALPEAEQAYQIARRLKVAWDIRRAADILARCHAALANYREAYVYQRRAQQWADSLLSESKERKINELHLKHKEEENNELMKVNESSQSTIKRNSVIIVVIGLLAALLAVALIYLRRSLTHRNRLNQTLKQNFEAITVQNEELEFHRKELIASNQTKDQVLSVLGHDLRAPFSTALQSIDLMRGGYLNKDEHKNVLDAFEQQLTHLTRLLNDLFEWAGSHQSGKTLKLEQLNLFEVVTETLALYGAAFENKEITIAHDDMLNRWIYADRARLKIVLQNIIGNAIKFTQRGGEIQIHYTEEHGVTAVHISDSGVGMSKEKQERLFKFSGQHVSEPGTEQERGTGLGLLLIKQLMDEIGGKIRIKSQEGKGSEFMLLFGTATN